MTALFTWSDAWVLAAVAVGGGEKGARPEEIIAAGDLINRAIFSPRQLRHGLAKLIFHGHVAKHGENYAIAGAAKAMAERVAGENPSSFDLLQAYEEFLDAAPYPAADVDDDDATVNVEELTDERIAMACQWYLKEYSAIKKEADEKGRS